jgi:hypothetical protein
VARHVGVRPPYVSHLITKLQGRLGKQPAIDRVRNDLAAVLEASGAVMTLDEAAAALVAARGSSAEGDEAVRRARAIVRAASEVQRAAADEARFTIVRSGDRILLSLTGGPAASDWAAKLGPPADELAEADPLLPPASVAARLRATAPPPDGLRIDDTRLIRLAAAASRKAAVSSKQELYPAACRPRGPSASPSALISRQAITPDEIREVIRSRYPEACPLPDQAALGLLLTEAGCEFDWLPDQGCFKNRAKFTYTVTTGSRMPTRLPTDPSLAGATSPVPSTVPAAHAPDQLSPGGLEARQFDAQLARAAKGGQFVAILVPLKLYDAAAAELEHRYGVATIDVKTEMLATMQQLARENDVPWEVVIASDDPAAGRRWVNLCRLTKQAGEIVQQKLLAEQGPLLLVRAGILARYDLLDVITALAQSSGTRGGVPNVWLLVPGSEPRRHRPEGGRAAGLDQERRPRPAGSADGGPMKSGR